LVGKCMLLEYLEPHCSLMWVRPILTVL
jgi:hypothetical protein